MADRVSLTPAAQGAGGQTSWVSESRRDFLTRAGRVAVGMCAVAGGVGVVGAVLPQIGTAGGDWLLIGSASDFKVGTMTWLREAELFVMRSAVGVAAMSSRCTHLGCTVQRTHDGFRCPCHGARFGHDGHVLAGPARRNLSRFALEVAPDGGLWVNRERVVTVTAVVPLGGMDGGGDSGGAG